MGQYIYGPVKSRRLGRSLGIDIVPMKTCSFDCVYCQLGGGHKPVIEREMFVPPAEVLPRAGENIRSSGPLDYVTLGGSGEPTLNTAFGEIAEELAGNYNVPVALLTNGSLMWMREVREACRHIDLVVPSLDACDEETFQAVNRPHPSLNFAKIADGLSGLRDVFDGSLWLEIFIVKGINDSDRHCSAFRTLIDRIRPDKVHLNTAVRPPAEAFVRAPSYERMKQICRLLGPKAEIIVPPPENTGPGRDISEENIMNILRRRPSRAHEIADACGASEKETVEKLHNMVSDAKIVEITRAGESFFQPPKDRAGDN